MKLSFPKAVIVFTNGSKMEAGAHLSVYILEKKKLTNRVSSTFPQQLKLRSRTSPVNFDQKLLIQLYKSDCNIDNYDTQSDYSFKHGSLKVRWLRVPIINSIKTRLVSEYKTTLVEKY